MRHPCTIPTSCLAGTLEGSDLKNTKGKVPLTTLRGTFLNSILGFVLNKKRHEPEMVGNFIFRTLVYLVIHDSGLVSL